MKKIITSIILATFVFGAASAASAAGRTYFGASYNNIDYDESGFTTVEPTALTFHLGRELGRVFSVEGRLGGGLDSGDVAEAPDDTKLSVIRLAGGYLKWQIPNKALKPYFMLGYTSVELELESAFIYQTGTQKGMSYGFGLDFLLSQNVALNLEYMDYVSGETDDGFGVDIEITSTNFGLKYFF